MSRRQTPSSPTYRPRLAMGAWLRSCRQVSHAVDADRVRSRGLADRGAGSPGRPATPGEPPGERGKPTRFQIACMTLPYSRFPLAAGPDRASRRPATGTSPGARRTRRTAARCRSSPPTRRPTGRRSSAGDAATWAWSRCDVLGRSIPRHPRRPTSSGPASARPRPAGVPQVLTFGHTKGGNRKLWVERFKQLGPIGARPRRDDRRQAARRRDRHRRRLRRDRPRGGRRGDQGQLRRRQRDGLPRRRPDPRHQGVRRRGPQLLHQGPPQLPEGPGLRPRLRRDRPLQAAAAGRLHRPRHAALLREHLRPAPAPPGDRRGRRRPGPPGPRVPRGRDEGAADRAPRVREGVCFDSRRLTWLESCYGGRSSVR